MLQSKLASFARWASCVVYVLQVTVVFGELIILRKVKSGDVFHKDRFNIPRIKCANIKRLNRCGYYGGFERSAKNPCKCVCPPRRGTIVPFGKAWKCIENSETRRRQGCGFHFRSETPSSYIQILSSNQWKLLHAPSAGCRVLNTQYLSCNGTWAPIRGATTKINMIGDGYDQVAREYSYRIRVKIGALTSGKLFKISLTCEPFQGRPCIMMKMKGVMKCLHNSRGKAKHLISIPSRTSRTFLVQSTILTSNEHLSRKKTAGVTHQKTTKQWSGSVHTKSDQNTDLLRVVFPPNQTDQGHKQDESLTTVLTLAAMVIGIVIVILSVNLFCFSSKHDRDGECKVLRRQVNSQYSKERPNSFEIREDKVTGTSTAIS